MRDDCSGGSKVKVEQLVRYPVKGLGPEYLECVEVEKGGSIPYDRVFAIAHGETEFDAGSPVYLGKQHFLMLMSNPRAWEEKRLVGSTIECGDLKFRVVQEISRCKATCVNPATAEVDVNVPFELRRNYDTLNMGLYLSVVRGGTIRAGQDLHFHS